MENISKAIKIYFKAHLKEIKIPLYEDGVILKLYNHIFRNCWVPIVAKIGKLDNIDNNNIIEIKENVKKNILKYLVG